MIPIIRIDALAYENMFCMFCGNLIFSEFSEEEETTYCGHVMFIATNEAEYEHQSPLLADKLPPVYDEDDEDDLGDGTLFMERLNKIPVFPEDSFIIEIHEGPPAPGTIWVCFSAIGE